jgi:hypothetical protein
MGKKKNKTHQTHPTQGDELSDNNPGNANPGNANPGNTAPPHPTMPPPPVALQKRDSKILHDLGIKALNSGSPSAGPSPSAAPAAAPFRNVSDGNSMAIPRVSRQGSVSDGHEGSPTKSSSPAFAPMSPGSSPAGTAGPKTGLSQTELFARLKLDNPGLNMAQPDLTKSPTLDLVPREVNESFADEYPEQPYTGLPKRTFSRGSTGTGPSKRLSPRGKSLGSEGPLTKLNKTLSRAESSSGGQGGSQYITGGGSQYMTAASFSRAGTMDNDKSSEDKDRSSSSPDAVMKSNPKIIIGDKSC